ncbi:hypothetical protein [Rubellimicrobium roseum]|uniref:Uncharacterized protein n=1 Tax=Rubellimicrobium roseum TaxID=687525 RepID=A0A5C4NAX2_9RHOB|nr:hypothetical protein [Rubellimicrobium roseum]TNC69848.1 hypothetical protein FHG71_13600 [Rubellimicrobium roseum]
MSAEPSRDELLDNTPEAVAMRRMRAARAEALARLAEAEAKPAAPRSRRRLLLGVALGGIGAARLLSQLTRGRQVP